MKKPKDPNLCWVCGKPRTDPVWELSHFCSLKCWDEASKEGKYKSESQSQWRMRNPDKVKKYKQRHEDKLKKVAVKLT